MTQAAGKIRAFSVHTRQTGRHHSRVLTETSFEAAAVAYIEDLHPPVGEDNEVSLIVRDVGTGHEQCFRIDLESGEAAPCD